MRVAPDQPFEIVYALYNHEFLGYLFESFAVQLDERGQLSFRYQNISSRNAEAFTHQLTPTDHLLLRWIDQIQQDVIIKKFHHKRIKPEEFFPKIFDPDKGNTAVQEAIHQYIQERMSKILQELKAHPENIFVMGKDGTPIHRPITLEQAPATIHFHFFKNDNNTHYYPTIKHEGKKLEFRNSETKIIAYQPAWILVGEHLYHFAQNIDGKKLKPFIQKKFVLVPKSAEKQYYRKFIAPLIAQHEVIAHGFTVKDYHPQPKPYLLIAPLSANSFELFDKNNQPTENIVFHLNFQYQDFLVKKHYTTQEVEVRTEEIDDTFVFHRIQRHIRTEEQIEQHLIAQGLPLQKGRVVLPKGRAFSWIGTHLETLQKYRIELIQQPGTEQQRYFIGSTQLNISVRENKDWFDIQALVRFGDYQIPFIKLRKWILEGNQEFKLPSGELAVIPEEWFTQYSELFHFMNIEKDQVFLKKHHLSLVYDLSEGNLAKIDLSQKIKGLQNFAQIEETPLPQKFKGTLRPYQKAGYDWMNFLETYQFGGCLADDMGLGKTVQTLALLQAQKEKNKSLSSLLIVPTSLIHNWLIEASKFTPQLKILNYTRTDRHKSVEHFSYYDLIVTSYGIIRVDIDILEKFYFHYAILDESQSIKNPDSATTKAVLRLKAKNRLILTGTPIENSTLDLWSQMAFINPGLLGTQRFFKKNFQIPIEKQADDHKRQRLHQLIKPFVLRRVKSQVAKDLPEKIEAIHYVTMPPKQKKFYEEAKSYYRNQILSHIETQGINKSQIILLQGLTKLRLIANHPAMVDEQYDINDSGKLEDVLYKIDEILSENHKLLIFSQFVKHLQLVKQQIQARKIPFAYLDGSTKNRQQQVDYFQNDPNCKIFLLSLKAGGVGLNLTAADYVFVLDPWWNPAVEAQAIDRTHRIGQQNQVFIYKFITQETVEEKILLLQEEKKHLAAQMITTEDSFIKQLSSADIQQLLN
ncbi:MAG: DEAD/DEAH box helicase [Bernardetiaceae bacterium]